MTASSDVDRILAAWFDEAAPEAAPRDLVPAIAAATARVARRRRWLAFDRWLGGGSGPVVPVRAAVVVVLMLLLGLAGLYVLGSRPRVPPPFGPARPGLFALSTDGDVVTMAADGSRRVSFATDGAWASNPAFSRDGTRLAFWSRSIETGASDLVVVNVDGTGRRTIAQNTFSMHFNSNEGPAFDWSPDGSTIAYDYDPGSASQIMLARSDGSGVRAIGDPAWKASRPSWSPDGTLIAFSGGAGNDDRGLYVMPSDGRVANRLSTAPAIDGAFSAAWSPDGRHIAFTTFFYSTLMEVDVDGTNEHVVDMANFIGAASWSPDGTRMAWLHADWGHGMVNIADANGNDIQSYPSGRVPQNTPVYDNDCRCVGWSADGLNVIGVVTTDGFSMDGLIQIDPKTGESTILDAQNMGAWTQQRLAP